MENRQYVINYVYAKHGHIYTSFRFGLDNVSSELRADISGLGESDSWDMNQFSEINIRGLLKVHRDTEDYCEFLPKGESQYTRIAVFQLDPAQTETMLEEAIARDLVRMEVSI